MRGCAISAKAKPAASAAAFRSCRVEALVLAAATRAVIGCTRLQAARFEPGARVTPEAPQGAPETQRGARPEERACTVSARRSVLYISAWRSMLEAGPFIFMQASTRKCRSTSRDLLAWLSMSKRRPTSWTFSPMTSSAAKMFGSSAMILNSFQLTVPVESRSRPASISRKSSADCMSALRCSSIIIARSGCANFMAFSTNTPVKILSNAICVKATTKTKSPAVISDALTRGS
mmetsp:Transcript_52926/g.148513  ORF Transcript_52926/g.148513 Transcript_52926/m.148513 type:complete len:233 (-) Transcript_52926:598-1296(-)